MRRFCRIINVSCSCGPALIRRYLEVKDNSQRYPVARHNHDDLVSQCPGQELSWSYNILVVVWKGNGIGYLFARSLGTAQLRRQSLGPPGMVAVTLLGLHSFGLGGFDFRNGRLSAKRDNRSDSRTQKHLGFKSAPPR